MVCVMCSYCEYLGQGGSYQERIRAAEEHEEKCPDRLALEE